MSKKVHTNGDGEEKGYILTSTGAKVETVSVSPMLIQKTQTQGTPPAVPYRENATAFGEAEKEELTKDDLRNDEEKARWKEYIFAMDALNTKRNEDLLRVIFAKGVKVDEAKMEEWKREQVEDWGFDVPSNKIDLKVEYVQTDLIGGPEDMVNIMLDVMGKSGIPEKELENVRTMFRSSIRRDASSETEDGDGQVELA